MPENTCDHNKDEILSTEIAGLKELMLEKFDSLRITMGEIKEQTLKTNGRVSSLERWRSGIVACLSLIAFAIGILVYILPISK